MNITAIRHTRVAVPAGICYGQADVPLASTYADELEMLRLNVEGRKFDAVFCSPLTRCRQLANDLFPGLTIFDDDRLMELNFGRWELQRWDVVSETPEAKAWFGDFVEVRTHDGESFRDQLIRTSAFLDELKKQSYTAVALVAHGGILRSLNCLLTGISPLEAFQNKVDYGEVLEFKLKG